MGKKQKVKIRTENEQADKENKSLPKSETDQEDPIGADDPIAELEANLGSAQQEAQEAQDRYLRVSADFENYKKRSAREMEDFRKFANESLVKTLLPVVDNLERALDSVIDNQQADDPIAAGVQMTLSEILKIFEKFHVKSIESLEKPFDPCFHQAVMQEEADNHPDKTVLKELQKGYLMHDKLIRPSMVVVSKKKELPENHEDNQLPEKTQAKN
jgi:molecular chaperone GrpE